MRSSQCLAIAVLVAVAGCSAEQAPTDAGGDGSGFCRSSAECDDGFECTVDTCGADHRCQHIPIDAQCSAGERCVPGRGCIVGACSTDADCDDGFACTIDSCGVGNTCNHQAIDALCGALERCDPVADPTDGCVSSGECATADDCDDGVACTVDDCVVGNVCEYRPNDALCTADRRCHTGYGCFRFVECSVDADCADAPENFCDGISRCDPEFDCQPPAALRDCDDRDVCTIDSCDRAAEMCAREVNCEPAECWAANPTCLWSGCFSIDPVIRQHCAMGGVSYDIDRVCLEIRGPSLRMSTRTSSLADLTGLAPTGVVFDVGVIVSGGCEEHYRMDGTFSDRDHFDGTWTADYIDHDGFSCAFGGCPNQNISVSGTRIP